MAPSGHSTTSIPRPAGGRTHKRGNAQKSGNAPKNARTPKKGRRSGRDLTRELTREIPREKQLVKGRAKRLGLVVATMAVFGALAAAFFVLPVQTYLRQEDDIARKQQELDALDRANAALANEVDRLKTPEGVEEAAREEIGYVRRGEVQLTMLPLPDAPVALPGGWPFDAAAQIVAMGGAASATATEPTPTVLP